MRADAAPKGVYGFFRLERLAGGGLPTAEILDAARAPKPAGLPACGPSAEGHRIRRLRRLDGLPVAVEEIWLDGARAARIQASDLSDSLYLFYRAALGLTIVRVEDRIGIAAPPVWAPGGFAPVGPVCGHVERVGWDQGGARAEASWTWFDPGLCRYVSRLGKG